MADNDLSHLSTEELKKVLATADAEAAERSKMRDPANAPGMPSPLQINSIIGGLSTGSQHRTRTNQNTFLPTPDPEVQDLIQQRGGGPAVDAWRAMHFAPQTQETQDSNRTYTAQKAKELEVQSAAAALPGTGWFSNLLRPVNALTTKTPADMATLLTSHGASNLLSRLPQSSSASVNGVTGALKGYGLYEGGNQLNAALSGAPQPSLDPHTRGWLDNTLGALSGGLGAAVGVKGTPQGPDPYAAARQAFSDYRQQRASLVDQHEALQGQIDEQKPLLTSAKRAHGDANRQLSSQERDMKAAAAEAKGEDRQKFLGEQGQLAENEQAAGFEVKNAQRTAKQLAEEAATHQKKIAGNEKVSAAVTAENITDQILESQKKLDALRNPDTVDAGRVVGDHETQVRGEIKRLQGRLENAPNEGQKTQINDAIERNQDTLDALQESSKRAAIDAEKAKLRELKENRRQINQGRYDNIPTEEDLKLGRRSVDLHNATQSANSTLEDAIKRYQAAAIERTRHASTATGATTIDLANIERNRSLRAAAEKAQENRRAVEDYIANLEGQQGRVASAQKRLAANAVPEPKAPSQTASNVLKTAAKLAGPLAGAGVGHYGSGSMMGLPLYLGAAAGGAMHVLDSEPGRKFRQMLGQHVTPEAMKVIPNLVNGKIVPGRKDPFQP